jgi:Arc/MetJ-type ribon-helix-helix transcriptional regulator
MALYDKTSGPVMKVLSVRLTDSDQAVLEKVSAATGKSQSEVIKEALHLYAERAPTKSPAELAREFGLIGGFAGPADLAANARGYLRKRIRARGNRR